MKNYKLDIERVALELRSKYNVESYGINDIFSFVDRMNINLIRMPIDENSICGFSAVYEGKKVIVSNSSEILSREIFTIAHEIGHCLFDLDVDEQRLIVDEDINSNSKDFSEKRADYFAVVLLLPEEQLRKYIKFELEKRPSEIRALDVIRMQIEFNVSYAAIVMRLFDLGLIKSGLKNKLFLERDSKTSRKLFHVMKLNDDLIKSTDALKVPNKYYEYVFSNYENGYISFDKLKEALELVGFSTEGIEQHEINYDENIDFSDGDID